ncbi:MAG: hypothetical protein L6V35_04360 [Alistipes putredinis]|nr:MAG: hypothetical protein L6V35_04360 [Alistipes putredinis]
MFRETEFLGTRPSNGLLPQTGCQILYGRTSFGAALHRGQYSVEIFEVAHLGPECDETLLARKEYVGFELFGRKKPSALSRAGSAERMTSPVRHM